MALLISAIFCLLLIGLTASYFRRAHQGREALKRMENLAAEKNGRCLSEKYVNASTKLKWECEKGHSWEATPNSILRGRWCPTCDGSKRFTIEEMKQIASERGGWCLSDEYLDFSTNLRWECRLHHVWEATPRAITEGNWCPECGGSNLSTIIGMQDLAAEKGGLCLSDNYVDALTKLRWQCSKNHIWEATPEAIINGSWCPECARARRYTIEGMAELAAEQGGLCLSDKYVNSTTKLKWQCAKGHVWEATPRVVKQGSWCPECAGTIRLSIAEMQQMAEERGGKCLSDKYVDLSTKVKWQCAKGHVWEAAIRDIKEGSWCPECFES